MHLQYETSTAKSTRTRKEKTPRNGISESCNNVMTMHAQLFSSNHTCVRFESTQKNAMDTNTYTYIFLRIRISTGFQQQLLTGRVTIRSGVNQSRVSVLHG